MPTNLRISVLIIGPLSLANEATSMVTSVVVSVLLAPGKNNSFKTWYY